MFIIYCVFLKFITEKHFNRKKSFVGQDYSLVVDCLPSIYYIWDSESDPWNHKKNFIKIISLIFHCILDAISISEAHMNLLWLPSLLLQSLKRYNISSPFTFSMHF